MGIASPKNAVFGLLQRHTPPLHPRGRGQKSFHSKYGMTSSKIV